MAKTSQSPAKLKSQIIRFIMPESDQRRVVKNCPVHQSTMIKSM